MTNGDDRNVDSGIRISEMKWKDRTRGGFEYRIDDENAGGNFPIRGSIQIGGNKKWRWASNGHYYDGGYLSDFDLVPADPETLPEFDDLKGVAPDATGGMSSEAFIRKGRDSWGADPEPVEQVRSLDEYAKQMQIANQQILKDQGVDIELDDWISVSETKRKVFRSYARAVLNLANVKYREG